MKKIYIILISCLVLIVAIVAIIVLCRYKTQAIEINNFNINFEKYYNEEVYGNEVATVINNAIDNNEENNISKDEEGFYIENDSSIIVDIKIIDNNTTYKMETIYNGGISEFVQAYGEIQFKCTKIEYNSQNRVNYLLFEQISTQ